MRKRQFKLRDCGRVNGSALHCGEIVIDISRNRSVLMLVNSLR